MDIECSVKEVEQQLKEAGEQLALPPSSTKDLLDLFDKIEQLLTFVGQAPSISMQVALVPPMGALVHDELLKHSDLEVKISAAACLCEIARITAPDQPYKDEIMKEIFKIIVMAFGELSNLTGRNYYKSIHILESVAKVKSCLLMLDLECDDLVLKMFDEFLCKIRSNHPYNVFLAMEKIMTLVVEESDEIAPELLSLLISHVGKENKNVSRDLAEKVLRNCNNTLKSYSKTIMKLINSNLDGYAEVVTLLCQNANGNELTAIKSTNRGLNNNIMRNGGSQKKQKSIDYNELEPSRRGRPKKNKTNLIQDKSKKQSTNGSGPLMQEMNNTVQIKRGTSSKKRVANGSSGKLSTHDNKKIWGQDLAGHKIKVWWPLDKMYYDGAVSSYDPIEDKYKVLYADGDEELLDLKQEKWMLKDGTSPNQLHGQIATTPAKRIKKMAKREVESTPMQENKSNSPKSPTRADSSKADPAKSANTSDMNVSCNFDDNHKGDSVQTTDIYSELKLTEKMVDNVEENIELIPRVKSEEMRQELEDTRQEMEETRQQPESSEMKIEILEKK